MLICRRAILGENPSLNFRVINFDGVLKLEKRGISSQLVGQHFVSQQI